MFGDGIRKVASVAAAPLMLAGLLSLAAAEEPASPPCNSPAVVEEFKASFNASDGAQGLNVTAVGIENAAEVDPASILAVRIDRLSPPDVGSNVVLHCKAQLILDSGHTANAVFRVDMTLSGKEKIVEAPIYATDFAMLSLAANPAAAAPPVSPSQAPPTAAGPVSPQAGLTVAKPGVSKAPAGQNFAALGPVGPVQGQAILPLGTVLCASERDIESWATSHRPGASCYHLSSPAPYVVLSRNGTNRQQVRLLGGKLGGAVAWTASAPGIR